MNWKPISTVLSFLISTLTYFAFQSETSCAGIEKFPGIRFLPVKMIGELPKSIVNIRITDDGGKFQSLNNVSLGIEVVCLKRSFGDLFYARNHLNTHFKFEIDNYLPNGNPLGFTKKDLFWGVERIIVYASEGPWLVFLTKEGSFSIVKLDKDRISLEKNFARFDSDIKLPTDIRVAELNEENCRLLHDSEKNDFVFYHVPKQARFDNSRSRSAIIKWIVGAVCVSLAIFVVRHFLTNFDI